MSEHYKEKRRHPRYKVNCPVSFICYNKLRLGETTDLSLGGMNIQSHSVIFMGETYHFTVVMNGHSISPKGRVVYVENQPEFTYRAGVSFLQLSDDHHSHLDGFLSARQSCSQTSDPPA